MSARQCAAYSDNATPAQERHAQDVWFATYRARLVGGDSVVAATAHAYRIELLFWVLSDVMGRRTT